MDADDLKKRTKRFALRILKLIAALPKTVEGRVIGGQLAKAGYLGWSKLSRRMPWQVAGGVHCQNRRR
jgi:hypothetical protein